MRCAICMDMRIRTIHEVQLIMSTGLGSQGVAYGLGSCWKFGNTTSWLFLGCSVFVGVYFSLTLGLLEVCFSLGVPWLLGVVEMLFYGWIGERGIGQGYDVKMLKLGMIIEEALRQMTVLVFFWPFLFYGQMSQKWIKIPSNVTLHIHYFCRGFCVFLVSPRVACPVNQSIFVEHYSN